MDYKSFFNMSDGAFNSINLPLVFLITITNVFYGFCLALNRQRLKQSLRLLLGWLLTCSTIYCASLNLLCCLLKARVGVLPLFVLWIVVVYSMHNGMTCYVWLNFYYYVYIVPTQRALLIWMKKNIKLVVLVALTANTGVFSVGGAFMVVDGLHFGIFGIPSNHTWTECDEALMITTRFFFCVIQVYVFMCLLIMLVSSFSTARYLHRHTRNIVHGGRRVTNSIRSQMRVTITGSLQGLLYLLFYAQYLVESFISIFSPRSLLGISFTVSTLCLAFTTVNTGIGQAIFRKNAAFVWKALKARCSVGVVTDDVHASSKGRREN